MLTLVDVTREHAEIVALMLTALNEATGPVGVRGRTRESMAVTPHQAAARIAAMSAAEQALLAMVDGEAAGIISLRIVPYLSQDVPYAEITELYVVPGHRRTGIATRLMSEAERIAAARGCTAVHVNTADGNEAARLFYRAIGYEPHEIAFEKYLQ